MFVSVVLKASETQADKLLEHHLKIYDNWKQDWLSTIILLVAWKFQLNEHFDSFGTAIIVKLMKALIKNLPNAVEESKVALLTFVKALMALTMMLYRRNKQLEGSTKNEQMLAKELLQELLDAVPQVSTGKYSKCPLEHIITACNFSYTDSGNDILRRIPNDMQLIKLLLDCGIHVNDVDSHGNTILHHAVRSLNKEMHRWDWICHPDVFECLKLLLQKGVCPNARNSCNRLARNELQISSEISLFVVTIKIMEILNEYEKQQLVSLKYMAAVVVKRSLIPYDDLLPTALVKFVNLLGPRPKQCWEEEDAPEDWLFF